MFADKRGSEGRRQKAEVRGQKSEVRSQKSEVRSGVRTAKSEVTGQICTSGSEFGSDSRLSACIRGKFFIVSLTSVNLRLLLVRILSLEGQRRGGPDEP